MRFETMMRVILIALLAMATLPAWGQGKLLFGFSGGFLHQRPHFDQGSDHYKGFYLYHNSMNAYVNLLSVYYKLTDRKMLSFGMVHPTMKMKYRLSSKLAFGYPLCLDAPNGCNDEPYRTHTIRASYFSLHPRFHYKLAAHKAWSIWWIGGVQVSKNRPATPVGTPIGTEQYLYYFADQLEHKSKFTLGLKSAFEVSYNIANLWEVGLELGYNQGLNTLSKWHFFYKTGDGNLYRSSYTEYGSYAYLALSMRRYLKPFQP